MHMRIHRLDVTRPYNTLTLKGSFSQAEIHNWISYCIPEVPEKNQAADSEKVVYHFQNVFSGTMLQCEYCIGQAEFKTENITTLSILRDIITKNATKKRITLEISTNINESSIGAFHCLCPEYQQILSQKDAIRASHQTVVDVSDQIEGLLTDCFIDRFRVNVKSKIPELVRLIQTYDYGALVEYFVGQKMDDGSGSQWN